MLDRQTPYDWKNLPKASSGITRMLLLWFHNHGREFPWRTTTDPFLILSVELMLQRTRASQVAPVFEDYRDRFGSPADVVSAGRDEVEAIFQQLGLRWRAEYFWKLQQTLMANYGGSVPGEMSALLKLPGVGRYAATATRVFAFGDRATVIDANVLRILGRWYGIPFPDHARRSGRVADWASRHAPADPDLVRRFNWALIDFGGEVCLPRNPYCGLCPISQDCWYDSTS